MYFIPVWFDRFQVLILVDKKTYFKGRSLSSELKYIPETNTY